MPIQVGGIFAERYSIESLLGEGGMGSVFRAYDRTLDRRVALKVVRLEGTGGSSATGPQGRARLLREARSAAAFTHPNAVAIYDVGEVDGTTYIAMELIEGRSLRGYVGDKSVPMERRVFWLRDVARALAAAHKRGIIHRDVKPENVMISEDGAVKVLDFGIARRAQATADPLGPTAKQVESLTGGNTVVGTPLYMAPEQIRGEELDARVDQFAWGVVAYELLVGQLPWGTDTLRAVADMFTMAPTPPRERQPEIPEALAETILRALARRPADRFPTMHDLLVSFAPETLSRESWVPPRLSGVSPASRRRRPWLGSLATAILVAGAALVALKLRHAPERGDARSDAGRALAIIDQPRPQSDVPEAIKAYSEALAAFRSGNVPAAADALDNAVALDPSLGAAYVRMIPVNVEIHRDVAAPYRKATILLARLSSRDQEILHAYAPLIESDPVDYVEVVRRMSSLAAKYPNDAEIAAEAAQISQERLDSAASEREADRAIQLDPDFGFAWMLRGESKRTQGRIAEAMAEDEACFARFGSVNCLVDESLAAEYVGHSDALTIGRRLMALSTDSWIGANGAAGALYVSGAPFDSVRLTLKAGRPRVPQAIASDYVDGLLAIASGNLDDAHRLLVRARDGAPLARSFQSVLASLLIGVDRDRGDSAGELEDAERFLNALPAFSGRTRSVLDPIVSIFHVAMEHGKIDRSEYVQRRAEFVEWQTQQAGPEGRPILWISAYAEPARTPEEAREALDAARELGEPKFTRYGAPFGHVHLLAGDPSGALADLEREARATNAMTDPMAYIQAVVELGRAREQLHDVSGACAAYATVTARWAGAKGHSLTLGETKSRFRALRCDRGTR